MLSLDINIVFTILNLIIFYLLLKKFLFQPIQNIMEKRKEYLDSQKQAAEQMKEEAEGLKKQYKEMIDNVGEEGEKILESSRVKAEEEYDQIIKAAKDKEETIIRHAEEVAKERKEKAMREAQDQIVDLAISAAKHMVVNEGGTDRDETMLNDFLRQYGVMK